MEKRFGAILILLTDKSVVPKINSLLTESADIILGRQGMPLREKVLNIISLVIEGTTDQISALTGRIGKLKGVEVKSVLAKHKGVYNE